MWRIFDVMLAVGADAPTQQSEVAAVEGLWHEAQQLMLSMLQNLPLISLGLVLFVVMFWLSGPLSRVLVKPLGIVGSSALVTLVVRRTISLLLILLGLYLFLRLAGLTQFALAILSGTGVLGLILGFAFRDIAENFMASLLLSVQRPFNIGDVIEVQGHTGVVHQVTARATTLVDYDGNHIQIPNAAVYKNIIKNFTANPNIRGHFTIGIGYESGIRQAQALAMDILIKHEAVLAEPPPQVLINSLGSATVNLKNYYWINGQEHSLLKVSSVLMRLIMREFEQHGISLPDEARERIFPQGIALLQAGKEEDGAPKTGLTKEAEIQADQQLAEEDISSETEEIKEQGQQARDPEGGQNIL
ncbi:mechanosensitive ion channel family protein [Aliiglaciecola sp. CAU 1673]|uniref:mechanosensitive ion channel family protein n=1 Tax=Aliiglaciecola sp. CAU 1673 TaxID=3032595 RepID=UPI0023DB3FC7|nr:mechanosensitive ion channel family protein [Aliiglaciecola sp. CAU 1673]MDF2178168.1 mechanosensitive ion channel family protein [Aliiglaciecola sp. CAU 1673]